jgi:hypothetical protein
MIVINEFMSYLRSVLIMLHEGLLIININFYFYECE